MWNLRQRLGLHGRRTESAWKKYRANCEYGVRPKWQIIRDACDTKTAETGGKETPLRLGQWGTNKKVALTLRPGLEGLGWACKGLGGLGRAWEGLEGLGRAWKGLEGLGRAWEGLGGLGRAWEGLGEPGQARGGHIM